MIERDLPDNREVTTSEVTYRGKVWEISRDKFKYESGTLTRDYLRHPGAVAVVAVNEASEVLLISQYRHPVGQTMVEIPAGLLDNLDELPADAAARELLEETGYVANKWSVLLDMCTSPGSSSEAIRIYLATDLNFAPDITYSPHGEETEIQVWFEPVEQVVGKILNGFIQNPTAVSGILALSASQRTEIVRKFDCDWETRTHLINTGRVFKF